MSEVRVLCGPAAEVNPNALERLVREWTRDSDRTARVVCASSTAELLNAIDRSETIPIVIDVDSIDGRVASSLSSRLLPTAAVDVRRRGARPDLVGSGVTVVRGRGIAGYRWAISHVVNRAAWPVETISYGSEPDQVGDLRLPEATSPRAIVVLLHGGSWGEFWTRDLMDGVAVDIARRGAASWNVEYRRVGMSGGGWPDTLRDVANAIDFVSELERTRGIAFDFLVLVGHSAGAQLALWAAAQPTMSPQGRVQLRPSMVVSLAGVVDLVATAGRGLGGEDAVPQFLGGSPDEVPDRYRNACPTLLLPIGVPQVVVQGLRDSLTDLVDVCTTYVQRALTAGDLVTYLEFDDADHFSVIDPQSTAWIRVAEEIARLESRLPQT